MYITVIQEGRVYRILLFGIPFSVSSISYVFGCFLSDFGSNSDIACNRSIVINCNNKLCNMITLITVGFVPTCLHLAQLVHSMSGYRIKIRAVTILKINFGGST